MNDAIWEKLEAGQDLTLDEMSGAIDEIMHGAWPDEQIARLLTGINAKGPAVDELAGAAIAMRRNMAAIRTDRTDVIDTCGTGGDGSGTFNISTAAAIVTAAAGVPVAKHGNRSVTSKTGSADVLAQLGVNIEATVPQIERCLNEIGICFCFAPLAHQSMRHVSAVRKSLGVPTIFNLLGPLCNPAKAQYQLLGVGRPGMRDLMAAAVLKLGVRRAVLVTGEDGLDEVTLTGKTHATMAAGGELQKWDWSPTDFGLAVAGLESMQVSNPEESAAMIRRVLTKEKCPSRDIVVLNAAAAIWTAEKAASPNEAAAMAAEAIDSGAAQAKLEQLASLSHTA
ncbi:anthranilate phosphoribosyltransferase [Blastopirellula sp. JC732]|uniref:Anthranilate phosphoribosyltransferase n=1 Tax=Blastopirellula sediminis TaxID=2894196 RepID=A0A9X1SHR2_9BACT|nr:anthranilate phosphoribosyltransferase [Blastopirellula sediminis]MCC9605160.1 anthranilate phosphoribosyltransferase [Blastopirellula sediminis]MCC9631540.1 anthranilate phosphoribosyltransferase [Blastopirellula sediminis]